MRQLCVASLKQFKFRNHSSNARNFLLVFVFTRSCPLQRFGSRGKAVFGTLVHMDCSEDYCLVLVQLVLHKGGSKLWEYFHSAPSYLDRG